MKTVRDVLENPPTKKVKCDRCFGSGIINRRGMVTSDPCPKCGPKRSNEWDCKSGKMLVVDYKKAEKLIREIIKNENY